MLFALFEVTNSSNVIMENISVFLSNKYSKCYFSIIAIAKSRGRNRKEAKLLVGYVEKHHIIPKSLGGNDSIDNTVFLTAREHFICHRLLSKMTTGIARHKMTLASSIMTFGPTNNRYVPNSRTFEIIKLQASASLSYLTKGKPKHTEKSKAILSQKALGRPSKQKGTRRSDAIREQISKSISKTYKNGRAPNTGMKGKKLSNATKQKIKTSRSGYRHSDETKTKISMSGVGKHNIACPDHLKKYFSELYTGRAAPWRVGIEPANKGKRTSEETKAKQRESHKHRPQVCCPHCNKLVTTANYSRWHGDKCKLNL